MTRITNWIAILLNTLVIALSVRTLAVLMLCAIGLVLMIAFEYRRMRRCSKTTI